MPSPIPFKPPYSPPHCFFLLHTQTNFRSQVRSAESVHTVVPSAISYHRLPCRRPQSSSSPRRVVVGQIVDHLPLAQRNTSSLLEQLQLKVSHLDQLLVSSMNSSLLLSGWGRRLGKKLLKGPSKYKPEVDVKRWNIVSGDFVQVIQGPQTGQQGKVLHVLRQKNRVIIENVNLRRRIIKPKADGSPGKIITRPCAVHYSNVLLVDPTTGKPTKVARRFLEDGTRVRVSKASGQVIPRPDPLRNRKPRSVIQGPKDTSAVDASSVTFSDYEKYLPYIYKNFKMKV